MAIYHCSVKNIGRSQGRSATGAAAYRSAEKIHDERTGLTHDYTRKNGVDHTEILAPENAPAWVQDRSTLWNEVERIETRKDSRLCREIEVALPCELSRTENQKLVRDFVKSECVEKGMVADIAIHHAKEENPHAHILLTTREITSDGFGKKTVTGTKKTCSKHGENLGRNTRIKRWSWQGIKRGLITVPLKSRALSAFHRFI